jgi:hypothetical protein
MALSIPHFPNPFDPANPLANAYAWTSALALDLAAGTGRLCLNVHPRPEAWESPPVAQIVVTLGESFPPVTEARMPSLAELMADPEFAAAYEVIGSKLYAAVAAHHPALAGSSLV